jgi:hypothetical protein
VLAHHVQLAKRFDPSLLATLAKLGITRNDDDVVVNGMSTLGRRYADAPEGLIETVFLPAVEYFTGRRDARWVNLLWFLPKDKTPRGARRSDNDW